MIRTEERWPVPAWVSSIGLAAVAVAVIVILYEIWSVTTSAHAGLCSITNGVPFDSFPYPSQVFVLTAIGAYVLGHLSSRYVVETRPELTALLGQQVFQRPAIVIVVKVIVTGFLLLATLLNLYEAVAFATGQWPITFYVWCSTAASPALALAGAAAMSFLVGRWLWVAS